MIALTEEQTQHKIKLKSLEDEESKKIAVEVNMFKRKVALDHCLQLGFTLANTPGVEEIKPRASGMKGVEVNFDDLEVGETHSTVKSKKTKRVDLSKVSQENGVELITNYQRAGDSEEVDEFIKFDVGEGHDHETLNYNHKLRRKLRRAIDNAEIQKEVIVRTRALDYYTEKNREPPPELKTPIKPVNVKGQRVLENGKVETAKQERVRARMELAEYNKAARVLRRQAKQAAVEAGLRKHAELTGKLPPTGFTTKGTANGNDFVPDQRQNISTLDDPSPSVTRTIEALSRSLRAKRRRESDDLNIVGDHCRATDIPSYNSIMNIESLPALLEDKRLIKKRKRESEESAASSETSESTSSCHDEKPSQVFEPKLPITPEVEAASMINNERRAMIDAEAALTREAKKRKDKKKKSTSSLQEVDANADCNFREGAKGNGRFTSWNCNELPGDGNRKRKFRRLLGAAKSDAGAGLENVDGGAEFVPSPPRSSGVSVADLERQYERSVAQNQSSKRRGLGADRLGI